MCGRYTITRGNEILEVVHNVTIQADLHFVPRWNVAPSQDVPVILNTSELRAAMFRWGLIPSWAADEKVGYKMINARAETLDSKPAFKKALQSRRCLIPADGFYEWRKNPDGSKTPMYIRMKHGRAFAFAGLWETWHDPQGKKIQSCTIITTAPNALMATIHDRMPAIVHPEGHLDWLSPGEMPAAAAIAWLKPYAADEMEATPVRPLVNSPKNEGPELIQPDAQNETAPPERQGSLFG